MFLIDLSVTLRKILEMDPGLLPYTRGRCDLVRFSAYSQSPPSLQAQACSLLLAFPNSRPYLRIDPGGANVAHSAVMDRLT